MNHNVSISSEVAPRARAFSFLKGGGGGGGA